MPILLADIYATQGLNDRALRELASALPRMKSGTDRATLLLRRARLLAYHLNNLGRPARLYVMARNLEARPVEVRTERLGETATTRIEGQLGQVTLLEYFASTRGATLTLAPGELAAAYASPTLSPGSALPSSMMVSRSAMIWHGCETLVRALITGTVAYSASSSIRPWSRMRIMIAST